MLYEVITDGHEEGLARQQPLARADQLEHLEPRGQARHVDQEMVLLGGTDGDRP